MKDDELIEQIADKLYYPNSDSVLAKQKAHKIAELCKEHYREVVVGAVNEKTPLLGSVSLVSKIDIVEVINKAFE